MNIRDQDKFEMFSDTEERKRASEIKKILTSDVERPISKSSLTFLEENEKKEQATEIAIAKAATQDVVIETDKTSKIEEQKIHTRKLPTLSDDISKNLKFPKDIIDKLFSFLSNDIKSQNAITRINKATYRLFQADILTAKLLKHVLYGEMHHVAAMLQKAYQEFEELFKGNVDKITISETNFYRILCTCAIAEDKSYRFIEGTAYRMALGTKDASRVIHPDEGIADLIATYLKKLPDGNSLIASQKRDQKLPERRLQETKEEEAIRKAEEEKFYDEYFLPLIDAIREEKFVGKKSCQYFLLKSTKKPTKDAIKELLPFQNQAAYVHCGKYLYYIDSNTNECIELYIFAHSILNKELKPEDKASRQLSSDELHKLQRTVQHLLVNEHTENILSQFRKKLHPNKIIKTGFHFDDLLLLKAFEKYENNYNNFGGDYSFKNYLFWRQVIGYIQRYMPACYLQAFWEDLRSIVEDSRKLLRPLVPPDAVQADLLSAPFYLGYQYGLDRRPRGGASIRDCHSNLFFKFMSMKNSCPALCSEEAEKQKNPAAPAPN